MALQIPGEGVIRSGNAPINYNPSIEPKTTGEDVIDINAGLKDQEMGEKKVKKWYETSIGKFAIAATASIVAITAGIGINSAINSEKPSTSAVEPGPEGGDGDNLGGAAITEFTTESETPATETTETPTIAETEVANTEKKNVGFEDALDHPGQAELQGYLEQTPYSWTVSSVGGKPAYDTEIDGYKVSVYYTDLIDASDKEITVVVHGSPKSTGGPVTSTVRLIDRAVELAKES